jgi:hypothetical protein
VATKKQQRRKYKRAVAHTRLHDERDPDAPAPSGSSPSRRAPAAGKPVMMGSREVKPPSYLRAAKRALIMSAILFAAIQLVDFGAGKPSLAGAALQAAVFFCWLTPFGYFMDLFLYRRALKRQG